MPSKTIPFISKKNAKTYTIVNRSQRDLHRHSIEHESKNDNEFVLVTNNDLDNDDDIQELDRQLDSIELNKEYMADDVANILFNNYQEGEYEEILDDFCITASEIPDENNLRNIQDFNFESHFSNLLKNTYEKEKPVMNQNDEWWEKTKQYFNNMKPLKNKKNNDFYYLESIYEMNEEDEDNGEDKIMLLTEEKQILHNKFQRTLAEYDSDEIGYIEEEEYIPVDKNQALSDLEMDTLLNKFTGEKKENFTNNMNYILINYDNQKETNLNEENLYRDIPYIAHYKKEQWDCESILSTYSNLSNNPSIISRQSTKMKKKKSKQKKNELQNNQLIGEYYTTPKINKGKKREKNERKDKKRERKNILKQDKQKRKVERKVMRVVFHNELSQFTMNEARDTIKGKSVFKY